MSEEIRYELGQLAVQHYAAGRLSFRNTGLQVTGHLLHRAIEYGFKAALIQSLSLSELKRIGHSVTKLHRQLEPLWPALATEKHRSAVESLDRWENIRYPRLRSGSGRLTVISPFPLPPDSAASLDGSASVERYQIVVQDIDELFAQALAAARLNPDAFFVSLSELAREKVREFNAVESIVNACRSTASASA